MIENINTTVHGYYKTLSEAKYSLVKMVKDGTPRSEIRIVMLRGQYFGEGFHKYRLYLADNNRFLKEDIN